MVTSRDILDMMRYHGLTYRQLDYWCRQGYVKPAWESKGSGHPRCFTLEEVRVVTTMAKLVSVGIAPASAHYAARHNGRLSADVRVIIDETKPQAA
jgi:DNA-binding transcriptional MerR regulator